MNKTIKIDNENDLEDKRCEICENIFIDIDVLIKMVFSKKIYFDSNSINYHEVNYKLYEIRTHFAMILNSHKNEHRLINVSLDDYKLNEVFSSSNFSKLEDKECIQVILNILSNVKYGILELFKSNYFNNCDTDILTLKDVIMMIQQNLLSLIYSIINIKYKSSLKESN